MRIFIISLLTLVVVSAQAQDTSYDLTGRWGLGIGLGGTSVLGPNGFTEGNGELDGGFAGSVWGRYHYNSRWGVEASYSRLAFDFSKNIAVLNNLDPAANLFMVHGAYRAWPKEQMHMLVQLGAGLVTGSDFTVTGDSSFSKLAVSARLGAEYMATRDLMLALHLDYQHLKMGDGPASSLQVLAPMVGITYYFGKSSSAKPTVGDSDGDGVTDDLDKCAGTAAGTNVGADGCPLSGNATDTDKDGVTDANDKCPGTPAGEKVNEFGCAKTEKIEITLNVQFASGSSKLDGKSTTDVDKFGEFLVKYQDTMAEIEGHTDNTGSEKLNYSISQKRAEAVREYLIKKFAIDKKRLTAKGYGPSQPVADNTKPEGRLKNRRVVAHVTTDAPVKK